MNIIQRMYVRLAFAVRPIETEVLIIAKC